MPSKSRNQIYGNCRVLSPEGILMFRCDTKKANWYLSRSFAITLNDDPLTIQLTFEPKGLGNYNRPYGLVELENKCVRCGSEEELTRHHVVPHCYRRHFPEEYKTHNHHDVVALCIDCHDSYERYADEYKKELSNTYNAPIDGMWDKVNDISVKVSKIATALSIHGDVIPTVKKEKMMNELSILLGHTDFLDNMEQLMIRPKPEMRKSHGEMVVEQLKSIDEFIISWRQHFVSNAKPKFLPNSWDINNSTKL
jgi:5-methylcytosine-specific restriction endonuclease McrA